MSDNIQSANPIPTGTHMRLVGRSLARCQALQLLFQAEASGRHVSDVLNGEYALSEGPLDEYGRRIALGTDKHELELDRVLAAAAQNWSLSRMSAVDRNLLRLSLYEILFEDDVDVAVCISQCVELAKAFGSSDESSRFVNGVLGHIAHDVADGVDVIEQGRACAAEEAAAFEREREARELEEHDRAMREFEECERMDNEPEYPSWSQDTNRYNEGDRYGREA